MVSVKRSAQVVSQSFHSSVRERFVENAANLGFEAPYGGLNVLDGQLWAVKNALSTMENRKVSVPHYINFFRLKNGEQGALIYTLRGPRPLIYCENALLGYDGAGPSISKVLLEFLEVNPAMFDKLQEELWTKTEYEVTLRVY